MSLLLLRARPPTVDPTRRDDSAGKTPVDLNAFPMALDVFLGRSERI